MFCEEVAKFLIVVEDWPLIECSRGIDGPGLSFFSLNSGMVRGSPLAGGVEVFQPESDRIDLAVATCALGFFLVREQALSRGEDLVIQPRDLWNI